MMKQFFEVLKNKLGYRSMEDWYNIRVEDIERNGGGGPLRSYYNSSPSKALERVYPKHNWELWRFKTVPRGYSAKLMKDKTELLRLMDWLSGQLSIKQLDDWYRVSMAQVSKFVQIVSAKDFSTMLQTSYPQHEWDFTLLHKIGVSVKSSQREVVLAVQQLFPSHSLNMEFDVFIEELKLASEYQGEQHYKHVYAIGSNIEEQQKRDEEKRRACKQNNITLVPVPFWWNREIDSLAATIHKVRSDLISTSEAKPITPPSHTLAWDETQGRIFKEDTVTTRSTIGATHAADTSGLPIQTPIKFFNHLAQVLNVSQPTDWCKVRREDVYKHGGQTILQQYYGDSLAKALARWFPDIEILPWMFHENAPKSFWKDEKNHTKYFAWLMTHLEYQHMDDWYKVTQEDIHKNGGRGLLRIYYHDSPSRALKNVYPEHNWELERFKNKPTQLWHTHQAERTEFLHDNTTQQEKTTLRNFWKPIENQKRFFEWLFHKLGLKYMEDWYNVTQEDIHQNGGDSLLNHYKGSHSLALQGVYPKHHWDFGKFKYKPRNFWKNEETHKQYFDRLYTELELICMEDWYDVTKEDIHKNGGGGLLVHYYNNSLTKALQRVYPKHKWSVDRFCQLGIGNIKVAPSPVY